ncbi:TadE family protein [Microbacterium sp. zg.Y625]|uniref:TadE family protein n=1 Tax=Microbacterium jiangjiandongii TaxID=3049071 RepID=UPI00214BC554|nr:MULTISPECIES: TadE family protein [unclassified Microbacterium]MCR2793054.1 TadE family protein [Microbacterium sp. zg.Y625]WIM24168.1 TadE family protein [Microbacterium sp. zg-Y625]
MPRWRASDDGAAGDDEGAAALEFILVGVILLVPLVYLIVALGAVQGQTLGVESGARHIARAVATAPDAATAAARTDAILASVVDEYGLAPDAVEVAISCTPAGAACPASGATLRVTVATRVTLPLVPSVLGLESIASVPVEAASVQKVSRFWGGG